MKYLLVLGDGMADYKVDELGGLTPLEAAKKPNIDGLSRKGELGLVKTVPDGMKPASDVANLSVMGYDPKIFYSGRSPLEAVSIGINMKDTDLAVRCNLVTLSQEEDAYEDKVMKDYSAGEISSEEAGELIDYIDEKLGNNILKFYSGVSYRHCLIWDNGTVGLGCTPPHDILERKITEYMPKNNIVSELQKKSYELLKDHPVNRERIKKGLNPANSIWLWGEGKKPMLENFNEKFKLKGSVISAVDLIKGIGICAGLNSVDVEGATGTVHTNFDGKAMAIIEEFRRGQDFIYAHFEAPDECGHQMDIENKVRSIELIDQKVVGPVLDYLKNTEEDFSVMVLPDHPTPLRLRTHTSDPVPFLIYRSGKDCGNGYVYNEENGAKTGIFVSEGHKLIEKFLEV